MYIASRNSKDNMVHSTGCGYAGRILPRNKVYYDTAETAYTKGKCACRYCAAVMQYVNKEMDLLKEMCGDYGYELLFDAATGTIDVVTPDSEWKIAVAGASRKLVLFHKNTANYDDGSSPYVGYHFQNAQCSSVSGYLEMIREHDKYKQEQAELVGILNRSNKRYLRRECVTSIQSKRRIEKMRSSKRYYTSREWTRYHKGA